MTGTEGSQKSSQGSLEKGRMANRRLVGSSGFSSGRLERRQRRRSGFRKKGNVLVRRSSTRTADVGVERLTDDSDTSNRSGLESGLWLVAHCAPCMRPQRLVPERLKRCLCVVDLNIRPRDSVASPRIAEDLTLGAKKTENRRRLGAWTLEQRAQNRERCGDAHARENEPPFVTSAYSSPWRQVEKAQERNHAELPTRLGFESTANGCSNTSTSAIS